AVQCLFHLAQLGDLVVNPRFRRLQKVIAHIKLFGAAVKLSAALRKTLEHLNLAFREAGGGDWIDSGNHALAHRGGGGGITCFTRCRRSLSRGILGRAFGCGALLACLHFGNAHIEEDPLRIRPHSAQLDAEDEKESNHHHRQNTNFCHHPRACHVAFVSISKSSFSASLRNFLCVVTGTSAADSSPSKSPAGSSS